MGRNNNQKTAAKARPGFVPAPQKKRADPGVPKFVALAAAKEARRAELAAKELSRLKGKGVVKQVQTIHNISTTSTPYQPDSEPHASTSSYSADDDGYAPLDPSIMLKDSSSKAFLSHLRKVIDQSDVIIQVLDARDPQGGRSKFVEEEVRKREIDGKRLIAVVNKIDLVPRPTVDLWLRHLRHSFPTLPFKSSTQSQRNHISSLSTPLSSTSATPTTALALGSAPLISLLKSYARTLPTGQSLTVGVVGFPNVGKSSLINSLKRSRACGVAATPGKTRVVQEVALDKGVKVLDCPGIVFDPGENEAHLSAEERRKKRAEIVLRNCVKAELIEDAMAPVELILERVKKETMQNLYAVPEYATATEFLTYLSLVRGRLAKGGVPDLEASAVQVLRDFNSGKIPYYVEPPKVHYSSVASRPADEVEGAGPRGMIVDSEGGAAAGRTGDAMIVDGFGKEFDLEGLFGQADKEAWEGVGEVVEGVDELEAEAEEMDVEQIGVTPTQTEKEDTAAKSFIDMMEEAEAEFVPSHPQQASHLLNPSLPASQKPTNKQSLARLFTPAEQVSMSQTNPLSKANLKKEAKRREKEKRRLERWAAGGGGEGDLDEVME